MASAARGMPRDRGYSLHRGRNPLSPRPSVLDKNIVGKRYPEQRFEVTAAGVRAFALACNEVNPRYLDDAGLDGIVAPPLFALVAASPSELLPLSDEALTGPAGEFQRHSIRGDNEVVFASMIRPGDVLISTAVVSGVDQKPNGELLRIDVSVRRDGREVARVGCGYFVAAEAGKSPAGTRNEGTGNPNDVSRRSVEEVGEAAVTADQPLRYADASGDRNPIHLDEAAARAAGLPGVVLQGPATMALVARGFIDRFCEGDPRRLRRMRVRYAKPVLPGDTLTTIAWHLDEQTTAHRWGLETKKQDGTIVIKNAYADIGR